MKVRIGTAEKRRLLRPFQRLFTRFFFINKKSFHRRGITQIEDRATDYVVEHIGSLMMSERVSWARAS
jgi:hypothetical protein